MSLPLVPDANHPACQTRSQVDEWEAKRSSMPRTWRGSGREDWDAKLPKEHYRHTTPASAPTQATQNSAVRPNGELRDQAERRKTTTEYWPC